MTGGAYVCTWSPKALITWDAYWKNILIWMKIETTRRLTNILDQWMLLKRICGAVCIVWKWLLESVMKSFKLRCFCNKHLTRNQWFWWPLKHMYVHGNQKYWLRVRCLLQKQHNLDENRKNETSNKYSVSLDATKTDMWSPMHCLKMTIRIRYDVVQIELFLQWASHT